jgi:hypothetical protein
MLCLIRDGYMSVCSDKLPYNHRHLMLECCLPFTNDPKKILCEAKCADGDGYTTSLLTTRRTSSLTHSPSEASSTKYYKIMFYGCLRDLDQILSCCESSL